MHESSQQKTMSNFKNLFEISKCQIQKKGTQLRIYHQMNLKELVQTFLEKSPSRIFDLGPGADVKTADGELADGRGKFGFCWGKVRVEKGLTLEYDMRVLSVKQDVDSEKSVDNSKMNVGGKMNLVEDVERGVNNIEVEPIECKSQQSPKKPEAPKVVFTLEVEVSAKLKIDEDLKR